MKKVESIFVNFEDLIDALRKFTEDSEKAQEIRKILEPSFKYGHNKTTRIALYLEKGVDINFIETESFK